MTQMGANDEKARDVLRAALDSFRGQLGAAPWSWSLAFAAEEDLFVLSVHQVRQRTPRTGAAPPRR